MAKAALLMVSRVLRGRVSCLSPILRMHGLCCWFPFEIFVSGLAPSFVYDRRLGLSHWPYAGQFPLEKYPGFDLSLVVEPKVSVLLDELPPVGLVPDNIHE